MRSENKYMIGKDLMGFKVIALLLAVCIAVVCCDTRVSSEKRSQINVLPKAIM